MFTGIVEELGEVVAVQPLADGENGAARLTVRGPRVTTDARAGDSISVDGVCLTVAEGGAGQFTADVMGETLRRTTLGALCAGAQVNLERAATLGSRLGGHLVQGHVDGVGRVLDRRAAEHWHVLRVGLPPGLGRYVVEKGSVAFDGVSLTVVEVRDEDPPSVTVGLIPETLARTTLGLRMAGDSVNVEVDVVAKYIGKHVAEHVAQHVERLLGDGAPGAPHRKDDQD